MVELFKIDFFPNPVQKQFIESQPLRQDGSPGADLFSSRMGEGKSAGLAWSTFYHTRHNPGAVWYLIRDTWENLRATTMEEFFKWFPPGIMGTFHATNKEFTWASGVAEGKVGFLGMDAPEDATKLMSRSIAGFGMDEPAPAVGSAGIDEMIFNMGMSRMRQPDMKWYGAKLAENNPDESHWTYKRFVAPGEKGFRLWQPAQPENTVHLPATYYQGLRKTFEHRPDLVRRFVEGDFGFQSVGKAVTPQWSDKMHLTYGLIPVPRQELILLWDFGHNPTCIITQKTPLGHWNILDAVVGDGIGVSELIGDAVKPLLTQRYDIRPGRSSYPIRHIGDPAGMTAEQTSILISAVRLLKRELGGSWRSGPVKPSERIEPLRSVLTRATGGRAVVQVDKEFAAPVWHALRGGWHFHVTRTGITSGEPVKDIHSHPGDAMSYGAAILWPMGKLQLPGKGLLQQPEPTYFQHGTAIPTPTAGPSRSFGIGKSYAVGELPTHGSLLPSDER